MAGARGRGVLDVHRRRVRRVLHRAADRDADGPADPGRHQRARRPAGQARSPTTRGSTAASHLRELQRAGVEVARIDEAYKALQRQAGRRRRVRRAGAALLRRQRGQGPRARWSARRSARRTTASFSSRGNPLRKQVNARCSQLREDGTYQQIYDKWFSDQVAPSAAGPGGRRAAARRAGRFVAARSAPRGSLPRLSQLVEQRPWRRQTNYSPDHPADLPAILGPLIFHRMRTTWPNGWRASSRRTCWKQRPAPASSPAPRGASPGSEARRNRPQPADARSCGGDGSPRAAGRVAPGRCASPAVRRIAASMRWRASSAPCSFPTRSQAYREARRVLKPGGAFLFNVWDRISDNEFADVVTQALATVFPARSASLHGAHAARLSRRGARSALTSRPRGSARLRWKRVEHTQQGRLAARSGDRLLPGNAAAQRNRGAGPTRLEEATDG